MKIDPASPKHLLPGLFLLILLISAAFAMAEDPGDLPEPVEVAPGEFVHDVGELHLTVTNQGLIGAVPGSGIPGSDAPSARWPGATGVDHLYAAGIWVGGEILGEALVSTGVYQREFRPFEDPLDTIYGARMDEPGAARYPAAMPDDDGDGLEDEDPFNGRDDDGDGLIDEDDGGIGDQGFRWESNDARPVSVEIYPDHTPMMLELITRSVQWDDDEADDFVGFDFTVVNRNVARIDDLYIGFFADYDIRETADPAETEDDLPGTYHGYVQAAGGEQVYVSAVYMFDGDPVAASGVIGTVLLGHSTDPAGISAPAEISALRTRFFTGQAPFDQGGDPVNDDERYRMLSMDLPNVGGQTPGDYRTLISCGPFASLAPLESLGCQFAMVAGADLDEFLQNAAEARLTWIGKSFDRDGDPNTGENGCEYVVRWLREDDVPVAADDARVEAAIDGAAVVLTVTQDRADWEGLLLERRVAGEPSRRWDLGRETAALAGAPSLVLRDPEPAGWPREYVLMRAALFGDSIFDSVLVEKPQFDDGALAVNPNPCNPGAEVKFSLPEAASVSLTIHDLAGRRVKTLSVGELPAGPHAVTWYGRDDRGRALPAGTYLLRLYTGTDLQTRKLQIVR